jgi:cell division septum initiation protein DivIVA
MEKSAPLSVLEDLLESNEKLEKKTESLERKINELTSLISQINKNLVTQSQNRPSEAININLVERTVSKTVKDALMGIDEPVKALSSRIDVLPKSIKTEINWIAFAVKGWKLFTISTLLTFSLAAAANYKLILMHYEKSQVIQRYQIQVEKLREKNPNTADKYFSNL